MRARRIVTVPVRAGYRAQTRFLARARRALFVRRVKIAARLVYAKVEIDVARDAVIGRHVRVQLEPGTQNRLVIGSNAMVRDDVLFWLRGGSIEIGSWTELRRLCMFNSSGTLSIGRECTVSYGVSIGCAASIAIGDLCGIGEYALITDSAHVRGGVEEKFDAAPVKAAPTRIGQSVWIGGHAIIGSGVTVGDCAFIGGGSVVTKDVPEWWLAVGVPARPIRRLTKEEQPPREERLV
jgi:acetyltransferase-like isoleucine patch superfamily enzyme